MSLIKSIQIAIDLAAMNGILAVNPKQSKELLTRVSNFANSLEGYADSKEAMGITEQVVLENILTRNGF